MSEDNTQVFPLETQGKYTWSEKADVVSFYMSVGNMRLVSEKKNIPYPTLCDWKKSEWWPTLVDELRLAKKLKQNAKIDTILESGIEVIKDRLENGDFILNNKTGVVQRKPVSLRDAGQITNALMTRQIQMEELAQRMDHRESSMKDTLDLLAKEFQKWNRLQKPVDIVDVESKEV